MEPHVPAPPPAPDPGDRLPAVTAFLSSLLKLVRILRLYPAGHPLIATATAELRGARAALDETTHIAVDHRTGSLVLDGTRVVPLPRSLGLLDKLLIEQKADVLAISGAAGETEIVSLAARLARPEDPAAADRDRDDRHPGVQLVAAGVMPVLDPALAAAVAAPFSLARLLAAAFPFRTPTASVPIPFQAWACPSLDGSSSALEQVHDVAQTLHRDPAGLARRVIAAAGERLAGAENDAPEDLLRALAHGLERLVLARLDEDGGGLAEARDTVNRVVAPLAPGFLRRLLPTGSDGASRADRLLQHFSPPTRIRLLKAAVRDGGLDRTEFSRLLEALTADAADEENLLTLLSQELDRDTAPAAEREPWLAVIGSSCPRRRRRAVVLLLAGDAETAARVQAALEEHGLTVHVLSNGARLVGEVERLAPDVVILDPQQRGTPGLPLIAALRRAGSRRRAVPLVVFTHEESFRHDFEVMSYPGCRFLLADEGLDRLRACLDEMLAAEPPPVSTAGRPVPSNYRPASEIARGHLYVPRFEILTFFEPGTGETTTFLDIVPLTASRTVMLLADGFRPDDGRDDTAVAVRAAMRELMDSGAEPRALIDALNTLFHEHFAGRPLITAHAVLVDSERPAITSCLAGGVRPIRIDALGDSEEIALPTGIVLGFSPAGVFKHTLQERVLPVGAGDSVLIFSHGLARTLGEGEEQRAFRRIRREMALAYHETRAPASPLLLARDRIAAAVQGAGEAATDRAAIWIRNLERRAPSRPTTRRRPAPARRTAAP
ncbi:MAG: SpoIIE family protein phosphatase [Planctomycetes bacterium]|nr:SpoIIE family protein phosphatase [Planctomycetota bacterium]